MAKINGGAAAGVAAVGGAAAWLNASVSGSDLWWRLAAGREIWSSAAVPSTDAFSYTFSDREWLNREWLWDALYFGAYALHPQAVAWLQLGVLALCFAFVFALARSTSGSSLAALVATWIAAWCAHGFLGVGPYATSLMLVAALLAAGRRPWAPYAWPPLVLLWVNLGAGVWFGLLAIALDVCVRTARASRAAGRVVLPRAPWIALLLCAAATLANPWGVRVFESPLAYLERAAAFRELLEWQSPGLSLDPRGFAGRFAWVALVAAAGVPVLWRRDPYPALLAAVGFALAVSARRFIPLFAVTAVPLVAVGIAALQTLARVRWPRLDSRAPRLTAGAAVLLAALGLWSGVRLTPRPLDRWTQHDLYPAAAVSYLEALGPPERVLNLYSWGGYLMLHLPESRVFIDGRAQALYDPELLADYVAIASGAPGSRARLAQHPADTALVPQQSRFAEVLRAGPDPWVPIYRDAVAEILVPPGSSLLHQPRPSPERVVGGEPQYRLALAQGLIDRGDPDRAAALLNEVIADDPLFTSAYGQLALLHAQRGDIAAIERVIAQGLKAHPRRARELREFEGRAYERAGDLTRALWAYRRTLPGGPFRTESGRLALIRRVERQLEQPLAGERP